MFLAHPCLEGLLCKNTAKAIARKYMLVQYSMDTTDIPEQSPWRVDQSH